MAAGTRGAATRRELRAAAVVLLAVVLLSAVVGALWGVLSPAEQLLVVEPTRGATLTGESVHRFDAVALFAGFGAVSGLLSAVAAWRWRRMRGPIQCLGLLLGSVVGAWVMASLGDAVHSWDNPRPYAPQVGEIVSLPVGLDTVEALIPQPMVAALVLLILAGFSAGEDLGTGWSSPFDESRAQLPDGQPGNPLGPAQSVAPEASGSASAGASTPPGAPPNTASAAPPTPPG